VGSCPHDRWLDVCVVGWFWFTFTQFCWYTLDTVDLHHTTTDIPPLLLFTPRMITHVRFATPHVVTTDDCSPRWFGSPHAHTARGYISRWLQLSVLTCHLDCCLPRCVHVRQLFPLHHTRCGPHTLVRLFHPDTRTVLFWTYTHTLHSPGRSCRGEPWIHGSLPYRSSTADWFMVVTHTLRGLHDPR